MALCSGFTLEINELNESVNLLRQRLLLLQENQEKKIAPEMSPLQSLPGLDHFFGEFVLAEESVVESAVESAKSVEIPVPMKNLEKSSPPMPSPEFKQAIVDPIADAVARAMQSKSLLLLVDDDPALIEKRNLHRKTDDILQLGTHLFPLLVDLNTFLQQFRSTLAFAARRALVARIISAVREFHEFYHPLPTEVPMIQLKKPKEETVVVKLPSLSIISPTIKVSSVKSKSIDETNGNGLSNSLMPIPSESKRRKSAATLVLAPVPEVTNLKYEHRDSSIKPPIQIESMHSQDSHPIIKHLLSHSETPKAVPLPIALPSPSTSSLAARRMKVVEPISTARSPSTSSVERRPSAPFTMSTTSMASTGAVSTVTTKPTTNISRVHGMIQSSRFLLINGLFSDDWRLMVPTQSVATVYSGQILPPVILESDVRPLRYQPPEVALRIERNAFSSQDVFSVGLVLFEVLTGMPLFSTDDEALRAYETTRDIYPTLPFSSKKPAEYFIEKYVRARLNYLNVDDRKVRDFLYRLLQWQPQARPTMAKAAAHPFLS